MPLKYTPSTEKIAKSYQRTTRMVPNMGVSALTVINPGRPVYGFESERDSLLTPLRGMRFGAPQRRSKSRSARRSRRTSRRFPAQSIGVQHMSRRRRSRKLRSNKRRHSRKLRRNPNYVVMNRTSKRRTSRRRHSRKLRSNPNYVVMNRRTSKRRTSRRRHSRKLRSNPNYVVMNRKRRTSRRRHSRGK